MKFGQKVGAQEQQPSVFNSKKASENPEALQLFKRQVLKSVKAHSIQTFTVNDTESRKQLEVLLSEHLDKIKIEICLTDNISPLSEEDTDSNGTQLMHQADSASNSEMRSQQSFLEMKKSTGNMSHFGGSFMKINSAEQETESGQMLSARTMVVKGSDDVSDLKAIEEPNPELDGLFEEAAKLGKKAEEGAKAIDAAFKNFKLQ